MKCKKCGRPFDQRQLLEGFCQECIFTMAESQTKVDRKKLAEAKELIEAETSGLFSGELLRGILDELADRLDAGEDRADAVTHAANEIQRLGGLGACREMRAMAESLEHLSEEIYQDIQKKVRVLSGLGRHG